MASGGQSARNRPALYQPTDFGSQQKRLSSSGEQKKEVETVTFKIQQRRLFGGDEKPSIMENKVKILKGGAEKKCNAKNSEEAPGGVAPKDLEKINKLKEYMAKIGDEAPNSGSSISKSVEPTTFGKDTVTSFGKADGSPVKPSAALVTKTGMLYAKGPVVTGKSPVMTGKGGLLGVGKFSGEFGKPIAKQSKESKERDAMKEDKGSKDSKLPRDGKESRNNKGGRNSRNQKNVNKAAVRNKGNQNEKSNKISKNTELNQSGKPLSKTPVTSASISNGGTRPKIVTSKGLVNNQRLPNDSHKSQNRPFDRAQNHSSVNSYYSQANNVTGYHSNDHSQWLAAQYAMSGLQLNNQSILGQPQGRPIDYQKSVTATQDKNSDPKVGVNRAAAQKKPVTTVVATKDKSEQKKSLDFVKSFFDNDPEVQYHRKLNAETRNSVKVPASTPALPVPPKEEPVNRLHVSSHVNSHINSHVNSQQSFVHHNTHIPGTHISGSMATTYSSVYHNSNMGPNNLHPNPPSGHFHSNSAATALHLGATPNQLHGAISHPSSMQHAPGFDLYSQVNQMNPMLSASNFHGTVTNYPGGISHNTGSMNPTLPSYGSYFPDGSHMSHVHHIQQQIDPNVITDMLQSNSKNWQEKALTKCGPIDSNQARSLIEQLIDGTYECMVCCESVKWNHQVWSCSNCYHVFHLTCIRKWARSESAAVKEATCGLARASRHQA